MIERAGGKWSWLKRCAGGTTVVLILLVCASATANAQACAGDCNNDKFVKINELIIGVNIALDNAELTTCPSLNTNDNGKVDINELITAVNNALDGCFAPPASPVVVHGLVLKAGDRGAQPLPLSDATVRGRIDRNGNGTIESGEEISVATDSDGSYRLQIKAAKGDTLVVGFHADGVASLYRTIVSGPNADVVLNATLYGLENLSCEGSGCAVSGGALSIEGLPENVSGSATVFNPVTQPEAFPGDFSDDDGNLLLSGVFAAVELLGGSGEPVRQLDQPATLRMRIPRDTWSIIQDITPGNGQIDVPLYAFEEILGTWLRDGQGVLEDGNGRVFGENELGDIRSGEYNGVVVARGAVQHFSYWNVDWPVESHACITGTITDADGPVEGATVMPRGVTYTGTSTPQTTGRDGRFCIDVMRSEGPEEDVDQDGIPGETQRVGLRISYRGKLYDGGEHSIPTSQGSCGSSGCLDIIGEISLNPDRELQAAVCTLSGTVRSVDGAPVAGAFVFGWDETVPEDVQNSLCFDPQHFCQFFADTGEDGTFTITTAVLDGLFYYAYHESGDETSSLLRFSQGNTRGCPSQPLDITLSEGFRNVTNLTPAVSGKVISWTPVEYKATLIIVSGVTGPKWFLSSASSSIATPVTYGTVPAGAEQTFPINGSPPAALSAGDTVEIFLSGTGSDGYPYYGYGTAVVP